MSLYIFVSIYEDLIYEDLGSPKKERMTEQVKKCCNDE
ncbi:hypothetical protein Pse7429DRAFT_3140 [Pseudanabaena biceps PCC 7429]|uniref:Uncharacterized protein n=1 Tax=Pseudanabaena biceps PCC 7429 TaxID=927668 RepID=L8MWE3_9CYAN|nr:hypothetical protein Pse7429DRAFT_3140 [Pseudanabaena biceps PCC 7429]